MFVSRALRAPAFVRHPSLGRVPLLGLSVAGALAIFGVAWAFPDYGDALLFTLALPLGVAAFGSGRSGGLFMGGFAGALAVLWWLERGQPGGLAWPTSRVLACVLVGAALGWFADSRRAFADALDHHRRLSLDLVATATFDGYFTEVNPAFTRTLGFSAAELTARPFMEFVHPDDREATLGAVRKQTEEGRDVFNFHNRYRTRDGGYRWLEWTSCPDSSGRSLIAIARDVTDRKQLEQLEHEYQGRLEANVRERTKELNRRNADLEAAQREMLVRVALAAEYRDDETFEHTSRVAHAAARLAEGLGLGEHEVALVREAAPLHDVGKLAVSDTVLLKPGRLTPDEVEHMQRHAAAGAALLSGSSSEVLRAAEEIALRHHEWWDGSGYPGGIAGDGIPLFARIVALADVYDALTHNRPYKGAWPVPEAVEEIVRLRGTQFDPAVVDVFLKLDPYELAGVPRENRDAASSSSSAAA